MSQRASRGGSYGRETGIIDLGHEPPLSVDGTEAAVIDRRRVSVQWFSGTILTGLCGAALIGGAVFASLDGEMTFAKIPERVEGALRGHVEIADAVRPIINLGHHHVVLGICRKKSLRALHFAVAGLGAFG